MGGCAALRTAWLRRQHRRDLSEGGGGRVARAKDTCAQALEEEAGPLGWWHASGRRGRRGRQGRPRPGGGQATSAVGAHEPPQLCPGSRAAARAEPGPDSDAEAEEEADGLKGWRLGAGRNGTRARRRPVRKGPRVRLLAGTGDARGRAYGGLRGRDAGPRSPARTHRAAGTERRRPRDDGREGGPPSASPASGASPSRLRPDRGAGSARSAARAAPRGCDLTSSQRAHPPHRSGHAHSCACRHHNAPHPRCRGHARAAAP